MKVFTRGFGVFLLQNSISTHTNLNTIQNRKLFPGFCSSHHQISRHPFFHTLLQTRLYRNTLWKTKKLVRKVAEGDRREVQEANVTTVSISSKLDPFLSAPWMTLRLVVVSCFHHPGAPRTGACWVPTWHQKDQVAAFQVHTFENLDYCNKVHLLK